MIKNRRGKRCPVGGLLTIKTHLRILDETDIAALPDITPGKYVVISISVTGCDMDSKTLEHIFDPFFTTKGKDKGTVLGLATSYGIISQYGGNISVYSEPEMGTTFRIYLPHYQRKAASQKKERTMLVDLKGRETIVLAAADSAPTAFIENGKQAGMLVDVINEAFNRAGYPVEIKIMPWARCLKEVEDGDVDGIFSVYDIAERHVALSTAKALGVANKIKELSPEVEAIPSYLAFTRKKDFTTIISAYNRVLLSMKNDGTYDKMFSKYLQ